MTHNLGGTSFDATLTLGYTLASQLQTRSTSNSALGWWTAPQRAQTYAANGLNQYTSINGASITHDANGNLTSDNSRTFTYDTENRLKTVTGSASLTLSYDPLGRLSQTAASGATTQFLYDGDRLAAEYDGAGTLLRRYVHGAGVDEPIVWYEGAGLGTKRWLHADERGSVIAHTDAAGAASVYAYGPYGEQPSWTGSRFRYTGQIMLPEAQLYHYKARVYDPSLGRFLQTDPIGYEDDINLYAYVGGDPGNKTDSSGLDGANFYIDSQYRLPQPDPEAVVKIAATAASLAPIGGALVEISKGNVFGAILEFSPTRRLEAAVDAALGFAKFAQKSGTKATMASAQVTEGGQIFTGLSGRGGPLAKNTKVDEAVAIAEQKLGSAAPGFSGKCCELSASAKTLNAGLSTEGASAAAVRIKTNAIEPACATCSEANKILGIRQANP